MARIIITGTSSGCGKTTLTIGLISALQKRGVRVASLKCGPDYIDPMFHKRALKINSSNIDLFMMGKEGTLSVMANAESESDITIIEGVMGYYDGLGGISTESSTYDIARKTNTPSILVVNARGKSISILAEIKGYLEYMEDSNIQGVILNNMSKSLYPGIKSLIENGFSIKCLGYLEKHKELGIESRHLGLITANEVKGIDTIIESLGSRVEESINIDEIIRLSSVEPILKTKNNSYEGLNVNIAVALDKGFNFYYSENIRVLEEMGGNIIYFSPIHSTHLPKDIHGIYIGGGYPELYLKELSNNISLREDILNRLKNGIPCIAECGGFMYLNKTIRGKDNIDYPMVGYLNGECYREDKLVRFGYINITGDNSFIHSGEMARGHEFHYYNSTVNGEDLTASKPISSREYKLGVVDENLFAGFHHTHFYSLLDLPKRFITKANRYKLSIGGKNG
ncbi:MAG: cobyrinate a,c-diamide synthase [Clostridium sp.]